MSIRPGPATDVTTASTLVLSSPTGPMTPELDCESGYAGRGVVCTGVDTTDRQIYTCDGTNWTRTK
jgi:hypothetical protein